MRKGTQEASFIDEQRILEALDAGKKYSTSDVLDVISKAKELKGLELEELSALLWVDDPEIEEEIYKAAREIKEEIYGKRIVFFAPLYVSDYCVNNCKYCAYKIDNDYSRRKLSADEIQEEVRVILDMGHKRIALEAGEDRVNCPIEYIVEAMETIYDTSSANGRIRRINVNIAATTVEEYKMLKDAGIGTYILFQETYHRDTYRRVHSGPKADYDWHTTAMDRAFTAGIDDVGLGVLFGLYDWRFETVALLMHAQYLDKTYGVGPHTISFPRLRPAYGMSLRDFPYVVADEDLKRIVASLRLSVPYTGMILSTREEPALRDEIVALGISQLSAGSMTGVGEYTESVQKAIDSLRYDEPPQFEVGDHRSLDQVIQDMLPHGYIPSFCTACYRSGRTGENFMSLAKTAHIHEMCQPNALLTFEEYLCDYASPETIDLAKPVMEKALSEIRPESLRKECEKRLERIKSGERDLFF
ncbi:MAG TPA: [FeFe] hydrogenase H-cluster radical SAM maturase HydG [Bacillota bacterium]|nr:[FeFe] hydrogenase H-cluster radical SAM maturase HydG [Bacillota bacterium]HOQ03224.1 [FeFe] hydrogenase H-cluster radical SAM maturase HydG [Bacillota bacterium]HPV13619.1 [FeFe] hydrogenase H-cluster radical SAM maturase HydG [Bacillota bacterium]HPZ78428.1 [FeFe] hydrogenase H-cluster radical SAM maturase HydG [Bacillota bacterium]HQD74464.1 [FeFe] hydrogenase H-cluster radical SAM maturase HydG [Bacillota bacterium]